MDLSLKQTLLIALGICVIGIVAFGIYYFNPKQIILRKLAKIRLKPIVSLSDNELVKVNGKAVNIQAPLIAPLSKRKCVYFTIKIEKKVSTGKNSHWKTVVNEEKIDPFFMEQNGSFVLINSTQNPKNYVSYLVVDSKLTSGVFNKPTPEALALLEKYNMDSKNFFGFHKQLRYQEGVIEIGEKITVAGVVKWNTLSEPLEGYNYSKIASLNHSETQKLIITDLPESKESRGLSV
ncbi:hypothetical protein ACFQ0I_04415 [Mariniflexile aquimaris]|uniref:RING-type E3 ubiquitin transferase n=1 Tax=Mariniflexile aquimaris TaxID=881009 RepID=A0ABW3BQQ6_9FLAO